MRYMLINDLNYIVRKGYYIYTYFFCILLFILVLFSNSGLSYDLLYMISGVNASLENGIMSVIIYLLTISIYLLISIHLLTKDLKIGIDNIFMRLNRYKWFVYKIISILVIDIILKIFFYLMIIIIFNKSISINIIILDILYTLLIQLLSYLILLVTSKYDKLIFIVPTLIIIFIRFLPINILSLKRYIYLLFIINFVLINFILLSSKYFNICLFEKYGGIK